MCIRDRSTGIFFCLHSSEEMGVQTEELPQYTPLVATGSSLSDEEEISYLESSRWFLVLCFVQLALAAFAFLNGGFFMLLFSVIFVSMGLSGLRHKRSKFLTVHFVYSLMVYIFSLITIFSIVIYDEHLPIGFLFVSLVIVLAQAIGLRHSRNLIMLAKKSECVLVLAEYPSVENVSIQTQTPVESSTQTAHGYNIPVSAVQLPPQYFAGGSFQMQTLNSGEQKQ
eukprot:TRINITY_DN15064_c0_g1_i1.p1 TRINITY_DN15064_c0_g1~~TRINITY_DN15064_c0_g1_i1.p1  ORF type:complete len:225 (+),score=48.91 TRINITY_DN15064_c0_g1_i1:3-677(+)